MECVQQPKQTKAAYPRGEARAGPWRRMETYAVKKQSRRMYFWGASIIHIRIALRVSREQIYIQTR